MLRYQGYTVSCQEVPGEISIDFLISGCGRVCPGCHSPELQQDEGRSLSNELLDILSRFRGLATCVCFMGEGTDGDALTRHLMVSQSLGYRTCLYSGADSVKDVAFAVPQLDYLKLGHYDQQLGGLDSPATNQRFFRRTDVGWEDITYIFQEKRVDSWTHSS